MNGWLALLFLGLAATWVLVYLLGRVAGLGRGEQARGDLAEKNNQLLDTVRQLEARVIGQHRRIVAMTAWETVPVGGPDRHSSLMPVRPGTEQVASAAEPRIPSPRPRPRERRTSTSAFLSAPPLTDPPLIVQADPTWLAYWHSLDRGEIVSDPVPDLEAPESSAWWRNTQDEIWSAELWLAAL